MKGNEKEKKRARENKSEKDRAGSLCDSVKPACVGNQRWLKPDAKTRTHNSPLSLIFSYNLSCRASRVTTPSYDPHGFTRITDVCFSASHRLQCAHPGHGPLSGRPQCERHALCSNSLLPCPRSRLPLPVQRQVSEDCVERWDRAGERKIAGERKSSGLGLMVEKRR